MRSTKRALVTGGAGFLGSNLCESLLIKGYLVICVDNLLTGSLENIKDFQDNPNFTFINHDVVKSLEVLGELDFIYHLASPASPNHKSPKSYHTLPFETMAVNTTGTWNLAELATQKSAKFLFASTSESYGDPLVHPQTEEYRGNVSTTGPRSVYDEAKRFGETVTAAYVRSKGLDGRIIRIFNTYGPKMALDDGRVVIEFIQAALKDEPIPIFGDGKQTRSFCFVSDLIEGIIKAMESPQTRGEIINLGNPGEFTISELAEIIIDLTHSKSKISFAQDLPKDDPLKRRPDITKAKQVLDWEPKVKLNEGLEILIPWVKDQLLEA